MRTSTLARTILLVALLLAAATTQAQCFKVLVLDALEGKPQGSFRVTCFCVGKMRDRGQVVSTGISGLAVLPYVCGEPGRIEVGTFLLDDKKSECGAMGAITFESILTTGVLSMPTGAGGIWRPTRISRKLRPVPGQLTIFTKKPKWWQSPVAG